MAATVTIRLNAEQRRRFDAEAQARGVGPSTLARDLLDERLLQIRRAQIQDESLEAGERYHASERAEHEAESYDGLDPLVWDGTAPYEGTVGGRRP